MGFVGCSYIRRFLYPRLFIAAWMRSVLSGVVPAPVANLRFHDWMSVAPNNLLYVRERGYGQSIDSDRRARCASRTDQITLT